MKDTPSGLPKSWVRTVVSAVAHTVSARASIGDRDRPLLTFAGLLPSGKLSLTSGEDASETCLLAEPGDLVLTKQGHVEGWVAKKTGMVPVTSEPIQVASTLSIIRPSGGVEPRFFAYQWQKQDVYQALKAALAGRTSATKDSLEAVSIALAPHAEQGRIVSAIESYFTRLDDAVATLERAQRNLKRYRASVLKAAVEGRLVPTEAELARAEGRSYEPASVILSRILAERRRRWEEAELAKMTAKGRAPKDDKWKARYVEPVAPDTSELPELPDGWCWASVDQIAVEAQIGLVRNRAAQRSDQGFPYIKMDQIDMDGTVRIEGSALVDASPEEVARFSVVEGDILFNTRNSVELVGKCGLVRSPPRHTLYNNNIMRIRTATDAYSPFVAAQMCSSLFRRQIEAVKRATTSVAAIYGKDLLPRAIALPPRAEQERVLTEVERLLSIGDSARSLLQSSIARLARLRQSILKWAFEGRLVDQDPTDEPATVLLERIRADRASAADAAPRRARRSMKKAPKS